MSYGGEHAFHDGRTIRSRLTRVAVSGAVHRVSGDDRELPTGPGRAGADVPAVPDHGYALGTRPLHGRSARKTPRAGVEHAVTAGQAPRGDGTGDSEPGRP